MLGLKLKQITLLALVSLSLLSGCSNSEKVDQENLCEVSGWQRDAVANVCKPGQKVVFLPSSFGNEQLPIIFAAINCDHQNAIVLTSGGVSCIYRPIKPAVDQKASEAK